jgi:hypothetical protein
MWQTVHLGRQQSTRTSRKHTTPVGVTPPASTSRISAKRVFTRNQQDIDDLSGREYELVASRRHCGTDHTCTTPRNNGDSTESVVEDSRPLCEHRAAIVCLLHGNHLLRQYTSYPISCIHVYIDVQSFKIHTKSSAILLLSSSYPHHPDPYLLSSITHHR